MTRDKRRALTERKLKQRKKLIYDFGLQGGTLYEKHREKITESVGYMRDGNVTHYVAVRHLPKPYKRSRNNDNALRGWESVFGSVEQRARGVEQVSRVV